MNLGIAANLSSSLLVQIGPIELNRCTVSIDNYIEALATCMENVNRESL